MDKNKMTQLPVVFLLAMLSCFLWGSATPAIKIGYEMFGIASSDTISKYQKTCHNYEFNQKTPKEEKLNLHENRLIDYFHLY